MLFRSASVYLLNGGGGYTQVLTYALLNGETGNLYAHQLPPGGFSTLSLNYRTQNPVAPGGYTGALVCYDADTTAVTHEKSDIFLLGNIS